jgi:hypothetical protein
MLKVLTTSAELESAQKVFVSRVQAFPHELMPTAIGYQGGTFITEVVWLPSLGIWAFFGLPPSGKSEGKRFWNAFGIGYPDHLVSIICEINPSREGVNRRTKGAFIVDEKGQVLICHRGMFNIAGGMTREFFRRHYRGIWLEADEDTQISTFVKVAQLDSAELGESLRDFVLQVDQIKKLARSD